MKPLRILALMHPELVPPETQAGLTAQQAYDSKTEYDVVRTLRAAGHDVHPLGVQYELFPIRDAILQLKHISSSTCSKNFTAKCCSTRTW